MLCDSAPHGDRELGCRLPNGGPHLRLGTRDGDTLIPDAISTLLQRACFATKQGEYPGTSLARIGHLEALLHALCFKFEFGDWPMDNRLETLCPSVILPRAAASRNKTFILVHSDRGGAWTRHGRDIVPHTRTTTPLSTTIMGQSASVSPLSRLRVYAFTRLRNPTTTASVI